MSQERNPYKEHVPSGGSGSYLKFEDGKTVKVRLLSDPAIFDSLYEGRASTKYAWIVVNLNENEVQIMQLPKTGYRTLAAIAADDDYGNPMEKTYDLKITRTGTRQQTKYNIVPVSSKEEIDEELMEEAKNIDLIERLNASPNAERAAWIFDEIDGKRPQREPKIEDVNHTVDEGTDDPVDLDDLPL